MILYDKKLPSLKDKILEEAKEKEKQEAKIKVVSRGKLKGAKKYAKKKILFDKFYNDYTKVYPLSGGLSKTANVDNVLKCNETKIADGIAEVIKFLNNKTPRIEEFYY